MALSPSLRTVLVSGTAFAALSLALPAAAAAQTVPPPAEEEEEATKPAATPTGATTPQEGADVSDDDEDDEGEAVIITGSRIRRDPNDSPLPLQIVTTQELAREGISSPEQLMMYLSTSGTGPENLASNADVVAGQQRGNNALSSANLRGQGNAATLVLLNGRRVAAHGLSGSAVDVNQIPFAAIERVEVLKDGASAIYGTDAIGGVINFITRKDYRGFGLQSFVDATELGDAPRYRLSGMAGFGDLSTQGFNIMGAVAYSWNKVLHGSRRDFVNTFQPERGLSPDTRGTPIATAFNIAANPFLTPQGTLLSGLTLSAPNGANAAAGGINILDLPGGAGCASMPGGGNYDIELWPNPGPTAFYACAWDTGRAAVLQQPIDTLTYYSRGVVSLGGDHEVFAEVTGSDAQSSKIFSHNQYSANNTTLPIAYPLNANTAATYNQVFNSIRGAFTDPAQRAALDARYGRPIAFRWRCIPCGPREYETETKTLRAALGIDGPLFGQWDYRVGGSYARSEAESVLGSGYHYRGVLIAPTADRGKPDPRAPIAPGATVPGIVGLINAGILNPFSLTQTPEAMAGLEAVSAEGTTLYGGRYGVRQLDASISGPLFNLWGGRVRAALGVDYRRETYEFNGSPAAEAGMPDIFNVAFDNVNALTPKKRNVKAAYAEILLPILDNLEVTGAFRLDDYTGFGTTTNPKVSVKFRPFRQLMFRGGYNTGFRVPSFNQIFNGVTISPYAGRDLADPVKCPGGVPNPSVPGCDIIQPSVLSGGNLNLGPETADQATLGVVLQPTRLFSASVDWWMINVDNSVHFPTLRELINNAAFFPERFERDAAGNVTTIDQRWINAGARRTQGLEVVLRGGLNAMGGLVSAGLDGTYLLRRREKLLPALPFQDLVGVFSYAGDLGIRWKHNAFVTWSNDLWSLSLSQIFRKGYRNQQLPGIAAGTVTRPDLVQRVSDYVIYNASVSFTGIEGMTFTMGIRNLFDRDPPFAVTYDSNTGAGSSWEPRVADPRGRSFTFATEFKF